MSLLITPDTTTAELAEAARNLRAEWAKTADAGRKAELRVELDALLDVFLRRTRVAH